MTENPEQPSLWKGAVAGIAAGLVASFAMDRFQALVATLSSSGRDGEPATEQAADKVAVAASGQAVPDDRKQSAGQAVHYAFGGTLGLGYGLAAEVAPAIAMGGGTAFGTGVAVLIDEAAVPAAGFGAAPWHTPASAHAYTLASHLVFGGAAELTRRLVRRVLG